MVGKGEGELQPGEVGLGGAQQHGPRQVVELATCMALVKESAALVANQMKEQMKEQAEKVKEQAEEMAKLVAEQTELTGKQMREVMNEVRTYVQRACEVIKAGELHDQRMQLLVQQMEERTAQHEKQLEEERLKLVEERERRDREEEQKLQNERQHEETRQQWVQELEYRDRQQQRPGEVEHGDDGGLGDIDEGDEEEEPSSEGEDEDDGTSSEGEEEEESSSEEGSSEEDEVSEEEDGEALLRQQLSIYEGKREAGNHSWKAGDEEDAMEMWERAAKSLQAVVRNDLLLLQMDTAMMETVRKKLQIIHLNLAQAYLKAECYREAVKACDRALAFDPGCVKALFRKSVALMEAKRYTRARTWTTKFLAVCPENAPAKQMLMEMDRLRKASP